MPPAPFHVLAAFFCGYETAVHASVVRQGRTCNLTRSRVD